MKHWQATFVSHHSVHPGGSLSWCTAFEAPTKMAARRLAGEALRQHDPEYCMHWRAPTLTELSEEAWLALATDPSEDQMYAELQRLCALLAITGEQDSWNQDEIADAEQLIACPDDEPEIFAVFSDFLRHVLEQRQYLPSDISADALRDAVVRMWQGEDLSTPPVDDAVDIDVSGQNLLFAEDVAKVVKKQPAPVPDFLQWCRPAGEVLDGADMTADDVASLLDSVPTGGSLVLYGLPNAVYHASPGWSKSMLDLAHRDLSLIEWYRAAPVDDEEASCALIGTALHAAVLEHDRFVAEYAQMPLYNLRTKDGKAAHEEFLAWAESEGRIALSAQDWRSVDMMRRSVLAHPTARSLLKAGVAELSVWWRMPSGVLLRARPDWLSLAGELLFALDVKTSKDPDDFGTAVERYRYHVQDVYYSYVLSQAFGRECDFAFCVVGKTPSMGRWPVAVVQLDELDREEGVRLCQHDIGLAQAWEEGSRGGVAVVQRPLWARRQDAARRAEVAA